MKKLLQQYSALALIASTPSIAAAQMSGTGELGFTDNTGNTESTALFAALKLKYDAENYTIKSLIEASYKSEDDTQTEERYILDVQGNRYYSKDKTYYSFVGVRLEKDKFEDIDLDSTLSIGLGKQLYKTEASLLTGELGLGQQNTEYLSSGTDSETQTVGVAKLDFAHKFNHQVQFLQDVSYKTGSEQTKIESNTGFKIKVAEKANLKLSYKYRHNDNPAPGTEETDTQTLLTLTYDF